MLDESNGVRKLGSAKKWWLDKSLASLSKSIEERGGKLCLLRSDDNTLNEILSLCESNNVTHVYWNRRYSQKEIALDKAIKAELSEAGIKASSFNGSLLKEPWELKTKSGGLYKVFTPFWKALKADFEPGHPGASSDVTFVADVERDSLTDWKLHPSGPDWSDGLEETWVPGENGAHATFSAFLDSGLEGYKAKRDRPDLLNTSRLSPYLSLGEISPHEIWSATLQKMRENTALESDGWAFLRELAWRDFSYSLQYQSEDLASHNWNDKFDAFPWSVEHKFLDAWKKGQTGYPIVDAGMRQLWATGWMHNRVRMIVASFLIKHLMIDWRVGERWFWDTLVDADTANNPASWQWVAGSGADASPYFRIFNPITQGEKFDPAGKYIRYWVPEIASLPDKYLFKPWTTPSALQDKLKVQIGQTYPCPVVEHEVAREKALNAYEETK